MRSSSQSSPARFFNTTGPVKPARHYHVPPLERMDLDEFRRLVAEERYFVLHAPRQTGKTSALLALQDLLNDEGRFSCAYVNVEGGQTAREDVARVVRAVLSELAARADDALGDGSLEEIWPEVLAKRGPDTALRVALTRWARAAPKPLVLLIDEIDALVGDSLLSVLRQLRAGYDLRPEGFPQSVVLCGVRDVRDYRIRSGSADTMVSGGSAFNVKAKSLRLGDFSREEVRFLLGQHTEETGQPFAEEALEAVWARTRGQPWLVNALAYEVCFEGEGGADRSRQIAEADVVAAQEALIRRRETHLDQLADKLREERVRRVVEPLLAGGGRIEREYGLGRGRTDLLVLWPAAADGGRRTGQRPREHKYVVECKVLHKGLERTVAEGVEQTARCMDRCGAAEGHLVVFDRREGRSWEEKTFRLARTAQDGTEVGVWGM